MLYDGDDLGLENDNDNIEYQRKQHCHRVYWLRKVANKQLAALVQGTVK